MTLTAVCRTSGSFAEGVYPGLSESQVQRIQIAVSEYHAMHGLCNILLNNGIHALVDYVRTSMVTDSMNVPNDVPLYCIIAMCALGPEQGGLPPRTLRDQLLKIVWTHSSGQIDRIVDLVVAFGCGKWRTVAVKHCDWYGEWDSAVLALISIIERYVKASNIWLSEHVVAYPDRMFWGSADGKSMIHTDSAYLAVRMMRPISPLSIGENQSLEICCTEDGAEYHVQDGEQGVTVLSGTIQSGVRLVFDTRTAAWLVKPGCKERVLEPGVRVVVLARDGETRISFTPAIQRVSLKEGEQVVISGPVMLDRRECNCGHIGCDSRHRLDAWTPSKEISLQSFIASAIKGPQPAIKTGSFVTGMYYAVLSGDGGALGLRLRYAPVEHKLCPNPFCTGTRSNHRYEGEKCPYCNTPFKPDNVYKKTFDYLIAVSGYEVYERQHRLRCRGGHDDHGQKIRCDNLYPVNSYGCPVCGLASRSRRPTSVWVRTFTKRLGIDELH